MSILIHPRLIRECGYSRDSRSEYHLYSSCMPYLLLLISFSVSIISEIQTGLPHTCPSSTRSTGAKRLRTSSPLRVSEDPLGLRILLALVPSYAVHRILYQQAIFQGWREGFEKIASPAGNPDRDSSITRIESSLFRKINRQYGLSG